MTELYGIKVRKLSQLGLGLLITHDRVIGISKIKTNLTACEGCLTKRQHRERFPKKSENRAEGLADLVHSDLVGPLPVQSLGGSRYFVVFTDDYSRKSWVYFLQRKGNTFSKFHMFKQQIESELRRKTVHSKLIKEVNSYLEILSHIARLMALNNN